MPVRLRKGLFGALVCSQILLSASGLTIPVNCDGILVGTITVNVAPDGLGIVGGFQTSAAFPTLADAAKACGEDHFNWEQIVVKEKFHPADKNGNPLTPPYVDPPPGGYGGSHPQWADDKPWFWDENPPPGPPFPPGYDPSFLLSNNTSGGFLSFDDFPGTGDGGSINFATFLVSLDKDGNLDSDTEGEPFFWYYEDPLGPIGPRVGFLPETGSTLILTSSALVCLLAMKRKMPTAVVASFGSVRLLNRIKLT